MLDQRLSSDGSLIAASLTDATAFATVFDRQAALRSVAGADRDALLLHVWADLTYSEIARATDIPVGTVRSRIHRARTQLRAQLDRNPAWARCRPMSADLYLDDGKYFYGMMLAQLKAVAKNDDLGEGVPKQERDAAIAAIDLAPDVARERMLAAT